MTKTSRQSTRHHKMHTEEHALKKRLPFTTFFQSARAAFIGKFSIFLSLRFQFLTFSDDSSILLLSRTGLEEDLVSEDTTSVINYRTNSYKERVQFKSFYQYF